MATTPENDKSGIDPEMIPTPEEDKSLLTLTTGRVARRIEEKQAKTLAQARALLVEAKGYAGGLDKVQGVEQKVRQDETAALEGELGDGKEQREQAELLANLTEQYPRMLEVLRKYEIDTQGAPFLVTIQRGLTPEVLKKALKLSKPTLLLIPPTTRQEKVAAMNAHKVEGQKQDTCAYDLNNPDLWNSDNPESAKQWRVTIVEGVEDVTADPEIDHREMNNFVMTKAWVKKYKKIGLDVVDSADAYLTLMMQSLSDGKPIDSQTLTVLNGKSTYLSSLLAYGVWYKDQVYLNRGVPSEAYDRLRLRGSVGVDVQNS